MNVATLDAAYRAEVRKILYPSLKNLQNKTEENKKALDKLIENLDSNRFDNEFPVISLLFNEPLKQSGKINTIEINLIDKTLIEQLKLIDQPVDSLILKLKDIIKEEIKCFNEDTSFVRLINERKDTDEETDYFVKVHEEAVKSLNVNLLKIFLESIDDPNKDPFENFKSFMKMFLKKTEKHGNVFFKKIISSLDFTKFIKKEENLIDFNAIFEYLQNHGLSEKILKNYEIHKVELSAMIHLKLLESGDIVDEYEYKTKIHLENELKQRIKNGKLPTSSSFHTQASGSEVKLIKTYEEATKELKKLILVSNIDFLNQWIVEYWLIYNLKQFYYNDDYQIIEEKRRKFMNGKHEAGYSYEKFENNKHFLDSKTAKQIRNMSAVKEFIEYIKKDKDRIKELNEFLKIYKEHFMSYGSNIFIYEHKTIEKTANRIFDVLKYTNLESKELYNAIKSAFEIFKAIVSIRYSGSREEYDGLGHFGGFAHELKYLKIKEINEVTTTSENVLKKLDEMIKMEKYENISIIYNEKEEKIETKDKLKSYLDNFNDLEVKKDENGLETVIQITDKNEMRKRTACISANKKFNCLNRNLMSEVTKHQTTQLSEIYSQENNKYIVAAGTKRKFVPEKYRYDVSTIFHCEVNRENFDSLKKSYSNRESKLTYVTSNETLSIFELIQRAGYITEPDTSLIKRFGYSSEPDGDVISISSQDEYKTYAYKYPHEYFGGPIAVVKKVFDRVIELYKEDDVSAGNDDLKKLRLWLYGHLFAAAQIDILDSRKSKFKQTFKYINGKPEYSQETLKTEHLLDLQKYIKEELMEDTDDENKDKLLFYIKTFFGESIELNDFLKLQDIIKEVYKNAFQRKFSCSGISEPQKRSLDKLLNREKPNDKIKELNKLESNNQEDYFNEVKAILEKAFT